MSHAPLAIGNLVLYKIRPAIIVNITDKIEIELEGSGKNKKVREKDIALIHPGPHVDLKKLHAGERDISEAWELIIGEETSLEELTELIYDDYTPATAWATWEVVRTGLHFEGKPKRIVGRSLESVHKDLAVIAKKASEKADWEAFVARLKKGTLQEDDKIKLREVEAVALMKEDKSNILTALNHENTRENAHQLLINTGYWPANYNPYPERYRLDLTNPTLDFASLPDEERVDFTSMSAHAIDDEGSDDPDDAISLHEGKIWVHIADVSAMISPDSELDLLARERASNLYLPDTVIHMLPPAMTDQLGLGLQETSPALSIGFKLNEQAEPIDTEIKISRIRVTRHTYDSANALMDQAPFAQLHEFVRAFQTRRDASGAISLDLPEVSVKVNQGQVAIRPLEKITSREMVSNLMLMAGEAVALYCTEKDIPIPYATQQAPDVDGLPVTLSDMCAFRRKFKPSRILTQPDSHSGLGLMAYTRTTSPLRRYLDLVVHQQLRAHLNGTEMLNIQQISDRIAMSDPNGLSIRRAERLSNTHWKLIYFQQNPSWQGDAIVVDVEERRFTIIIPELAFETKMRLTDPMTLNQAIKVKIRSVDIPELMARFSVLKN